MSKRVFMKRISILIGILIILALGGSYWLYQKLEVQEKVEVFNALPPSASFFIEVENWSSFNENFRLGKYYSMLSETGAVKKLLEQTGAMDELLAAPDSGSSLFDNRKLIINTSLTNAGEYDFLYLLETNNLNKETFRTFIKSLKGQNKIEERSYKSLGIFEISTNIGLLTIAFDKGILISSFTPFLVEESVEQLQKESWLTEDSGFQKLRKLSSGSEGIHAYLKVAEEKLFNELMLDPENQGMKEFVRDFASWVELQLDFEKNAILLNGYSVAEEGTFLSDFINVSSGNVEVGRVLPNNTAFFINTNAIFESKEESESDYYNYFKSWLGKSGGFSVGETLDENWEKALILYFQTDKIDLATESLSELAAMQGKANSLEYNGYKIEQLEGNKFDDLLGFPKLGVNDPYYCVISDFVLLANSPKELKSIISKYLNGSTLSRHSDYLRFTQQISSNSNFSMYLQPNFSYQMIKSLLNASLHKTLSAEEKSWKNLSHTAFQFSSFNGVFFTNGIIEFNSENESVNTPVVSSSKDKLWETQLETSLAKGPYVLVNHDNGYKEILVQDKNNKIYLIDRNGKILWSADLSGRIMGEEIYQIDYYKNGKLQMVFNTDEKIYLIDREGNNVAGFPIKLPVKADNAILMTNYDGKRVYRYFMAGKNKIYGFYQSGKPLPGWSPKVRAGDITQSMEYCQIQGIDYIIAANEQGELFYFDRRGEKKVNPILTKTKFNYPFAFVEHKNDFNLYNFDNENNELMVIDMDGKFKTVAMPDTISFFDFNAFDLDNDASDEIVFVDSTTIYVYNNEMQQLRSISSPVNIDSKVFKVDNQLGFYSKLDNQIWMLDASYSPVELFPLEANSRFTIADLFKNNNNILITTDSDNQLVTYKVSY